MRSVRNETDPVLAALSFTHYRELGPGRWVKKFMRRSCNTSVVHRAAPDSGLGGAAGAGRFSRTGIGACCLSLGGSSPHDNGQRSRKGHVAARIHQTKPVSISILPLPIEPTFRRTHSGWDFVRGVESVLCPQPSGSPGTANRTSYRDHAKRTGAGPAIPHVSPVALRAICCIHA